MAGCVKSDRPTWSWLNEMNLKHSSRGIELYSEQGADVRVLGNLFVVKTCTHTNARFLFGGI